MTILNRVARALPGTSSRFSRLLTIELVVFVLFALMPLLLGLVWSEDDSFFWIVFTTKVLILSLFALSFDLAWGYAGLMSFGQALFFGGAGYVVAVMSRDLGVSSIFIVLPVAVAVGLGLAMVLADFVTEPDRGRSRQGAFGKGVSGFGDVSDGVTFGQRARVHRTGDIAHE